MTRKNPPRKNNSPTFKPQQRNANRHTDRGLEALDRSLQNGFIGALTSAADGEIFDGSARLERVSELFAGVEPIVIRSNGDRPIIHIREDIPTAEDPKARELAIAANRIAQIDLDWDGAIVAEIAQEVDLGYLFTDEELDALNEWEQEAIDELNQDESGQESERESEGEGEGDRDSVPNIIWTSDNDWGVPTLDIAREAAGLSMPFIKWGVQARTEKHDGSFHFYTDDYKFQAIWDNPNRVIESGCVAVIEPNFSTWEGEPKAIALWDIYRKRWLSRYWQSHGIDIWVDVNVQPHLYDVNFLGVPQTWRAFATRYQKVLSDGTKAGLEWLDRDWKVICKYTGTTEAQLLVYGGSTPVQKYCLDRGWLWIPDHRQQVDE